MKTLADYKYYETELGVLYCGDCLDILPLIPDNSVDLVLTDPPYGINYKSNHTQNHDYIINDDFETWIKTFPPDMLVLEPFCGGGSTALACEKLNRRWIGIEISEKYCAIAKKRIEVEANQLKLFK